MIKNILILCTGNSCRSIIAEALVNLHLSSKGIKAYSAGVNPSNKINQNAKKVLQEYGGWKDEYYSKDIKQIQNIDFELVITVCNNAKEVCPVFPKNTKVLHIGFEDPDGKEYSAFIDTYNQIKTKLLPSVSSCI